MDTLLTILLVVVIACIGILILVPIFAFIVCYANWWWQKIDNIISDKEAKEIYKFKKNL